MTGLDPAAVGAEVRLGRTTRENAETKARRLLVEGRVMICRLDDHGLLASVRGDSGGVRSVVFHLGQWSCNCEARSSRCSHIRAVQLVVAVDVEEARR